MERLNGNLALERSPRNVRVLTALLLSAVAYLLIGRLFPQPAAHLRAWRLGAWGASGAVYAAHILYEHFKARSSPGTAAFRVAGAVAIGALALAAAAAIRSVSGGRTLRPVWLLALILWPLLTGVPAFLGALVAASVLGRITKKT